MWYRDIRTGKCFEELLGHKDSVLCVQVEGNKIVSGGGENDKTVKLWYTGPNSSSGSFSEISTRRNTSEIDYHNGSVFCVKFDERQLFTGSSDGLIHHYLYD